MFILRCIGFYNYIVGIFSFLILLNIVLENNVAAAKLNVVIESPLLSASAVSKSEDNRQYFGDDELNNDETIDVNEIVQICNDSYKITMDFLEAFNSTAELPDETDKTPMCFFRCVYERTGLIKNGKLNRDQIIKYIWPATGDSVEVCQKEGDNEKNPCLKVYLMAKCLMMRAIVDAKNKPKI